MTIYDSHLGKELSRVERDCKSRTCSERPLTDAELDADVVRSKREEDACDSQLQASDG